MESSTTSGPFIGYRRKLLSIDPLFPRRGDYDSTNNSRRSTKANATPEAAVDDGSWSRRDVTCCRGRDEALPVTGVGRRRSRRRTRDSRSLGSESESGKRKQVSKVSTTLRDSYSDDEASRRTCYIYWPHSTSMADRTPNLRYSGVDRQSQVRGCRLRGVNDSKTLRNLLVLGTSVMCWLTAFWSTQSLQSTLNHRRTLGVASLAALYSAATVSCFYAPPIIVSSPAHHPATVRQVDHRRSVRLPFVVHCR